MSFAAIQRQLAAEAGVSHVMVQQHRQVATVATSPQPSKIFTKSDAAKLVLAARLVDQVLARRKVVRP